MFAGYRQVDAFGEDEEYSEGEEVEYVTLDLGTVEPTLLPSSQTYSLIGLDTQTPFLQLSGTIFKGYHDSLLGTELLFEEEHHDGKSTRHVTHLASTERRIRFKEVTLEPKASMSTEEPGPSDDGPLQKRKGKEREKVSFVDKIAGVEQPKPVKRKGKGKQTSKKSKGKGKGKGKAVEAPVEGEFEPQEDQDSGMHMDVDEG